MGDISVSSVTSNGEDSEPENNTHSTKRRSRKANQTQNGTSKSQETAVSVESVKKTTAPKNNKPTALKDINTHQPSQPLIADSVDKKSDSTIVDSKRKTSSNKNDLNQLKADVVVGKETDGNQQIKDTKLASNQDTSNLKIPNTDAKRKPKESGSDLGELTVEAFTAVKDDGDVKESIKVVSVKIQESNQSGNHGTIESIESSMSTTVNQETSSFSTDTTSPSNSRNDSADNSKPSNLVSSVSETPIKPQSVNTSSGSFFSPINYFQTSSKKSPFSRKRKSMEGSVQPEEQPSKKREVLTSKDTNNAKKNQFDQHGEKSFSKDSQTNVELSQKSNNQLDTNIAIPTVPFEDSKLNNDLITPISKPLNRVAPRTAAPLRSSGYLDKSLPVQSPTLPYSTGTIPLSEKDKSLRISFMSHLDKTKNEDSSDIEDGELSFSNNDYFNPAQPSVQAATKKNGNEPRRFYKPPQQALAEKESLKTCEPKVDDVKQDSHTDQEEPSLDSEAEKPKEADTDNEDTKGHTEESTRLPVFALLQLLVLCLSIYSLSAFSKWYIASQYEAGYCSASFESEPTWIPKTKPLYQSLWVASPPVPETWEGYFEKEYLQSRLDQVQHQWRQIIDEIRPGCVQCPEHAICEGGFKLDCEEEYIKVNSLWSLGGRLPVPPKCVYDTSKQKKIDRIVKRALMLIDERKARYLCGYKDAESDEFEEQELQNKLHYMKAKTISDQQFEDLWQIALNEIKQKENIVVRLANKDEVNLPMTEASINDSKDDDEATEILPILGYDLDEIVPVSTYIKTEKAVRLPITCVFRQSVCKLFARYIAYAKYTLVFALLVVIGKKVKEIRDRRRAHIQSLANKAIVRLKQQLDLSKEDERGRTLACVAVGFLRDELQQDVADLRKRKKVWEQVQKIVESNGNVRSKQTDIRGEIMKVWEWIGPDFV